MATRRELAKLSSRTSSYNSVPDLDNDARNEMRPLYLSQSSDVSAFHQMNWIYTAVMSNKRKLLALVLILAVAVWWILTSTKPSSRLFITPGNAEWLCQKDRESCKAGDGTPHYEPFLPIVYVVFGDNGLPIARAIVKNTSPCPRLNVNSTTFDAPQVRERAVGDDTLPFAFPVRVCEADIGYDLLSSGASFGKKRIPAVTRDPSRFVLFGDTGLRVKPADLGIGDCSTSGPAVYGVHQCLFNISRDDVNLSSASGHFQSIGEWPLKTLMDHAATQKPDVVVHLGDYGYRQGPCPFPNLQSVDCSGVNLPRRFDFSGTDKVDNVMNFVPGTWGDNWWGWWADFFFPSLTLLASAPWIMLRGNHEMCSRAGHGWFLFFSPRPYPADTLGGSFCQEYTEPWNIPFQKEQFVVMDDNNLEPRDGGVDGLELIPGHCPVVSGDKQPIPQVMNRFLATNPQQDCDDIYSELDTFAHFFGKIQEMTASHDTNFYLGHRPVFGIACNDTELVTMDWTMQCSLGCQTLDKISALFSGHMHWREVITFQNNALPPQIVLGNGGTEQIPNYIVEGSLHKVTLEVGRNSMIKATVDKGDTDSTAFGFAVMDRTMERAYKIAFKGLNMSTGTMEQISSLSIPMGPRVEGSSACTKNEWSETCVLPEGHKCQR